MRPLIPWQPCVWQSLGHAPALSIVNVKGSTIARESDYVLYTHAGPEIAVASTKAYSVQLAALYLIYCRMALVRGTYTVQDRLQRFYGRTAYDAIPAMEAMIDRRDSEIKTYCYVILFRKNDAFFIGRGLDYAFSLEGALKLKEISYIHAEAYAAGELKHGTIALIYEQCPCYRHCHPGARFCQNHLQYHGKLRQEALLSSSLPRSTAVIEDGVAGCSDPYTGYCRPALPCSPSPLSLQLIAYYASIGKNLDVDQPRNLAKSVTVE